MYMGRTEWGSIVSPGRSVAVGLNSVYNKQCCCTTLAPRADGGGHSDTSKTDLAGLTRTGVLAISQQWAILKPEHWIKGRAQSQSHVIVRSRLSRTGWIPDKTGKRFAPRCQLALHRIGPKGPISFSCMAAYTSRGTRRCAPVTRPGLCFCIRRATKCWKRTSPNVTGAFSAG